MAPKNYDFCGWVTKNDIKCSDGRIIRKDAFAHQDGQKVPMVWMHNHSTPDAVVGYTILENRPEGVYGYSYCNNTENGKKTKELVQHGDVNSYSIFANKLKEQAANVLHGVIREVSIVLAGANDGARIQEVALSHSAEEVDEYDYNGLYDAIIVTGDSEMEMYHADENVKEESTEETVGDIIDGLTPKQLQAVDIMIEEAVNQALNDLLDDLENEDEEDEDEESEMSHSEDLDENYENNEVEDMKRNVFDSDSMPAEGGYLTHSDLTQIITTAQKTHAGSLKQVYEAYCDDRGLSHDADSDAGITRSTDVQNYGVNDPSFLFPDYKSLNNPPEFIKRDTNWVSVLLGKVHHTPFSRVKSQYANITADAARARGYIKGNKKVEEVFTLLKRTTDPQTIYKKQMIDRDDLLDITDFDYMAWLKGEMQLMIDEEKARAILIGDGRSSASNDKIQPTHIRPIWGDSDLFTIKKTVAGGTPVEFAKNLIEQAIRARKDYKGAGNPIMFTTEDYLTEMILLKDTIGHPLYKTEQELATTMRVSQIVTVPVMENVTNEAGDEEIVAIIVNPIDYNVGKDNRANGMFDDFDIDYNQYKVLKEERMSGALVTPYSAIALVKSTNPSQG